MPDEPTVDDVCRLAPFRVLRFQPPLTLPRRRRRIGRCRDEAAQRQHADERPARHAPNITENGSGETSCRSSPSIVLDIEHMFV
jgi:hypothetical protein